MQTRKSALRIGMIVLSPIVLLGGLMLFNAVNPMQAAFVTGFAVENQSGGDIWITPIGTRGEKGYKGTLPIYWMKFPSLPAIRSGQYHVKHGRTVTINYDWDDVIFFEIAVKTADGNCYEYIVDANPTANQYHPPKSDHFIIPPIKELTLSRPGILKVAEKGDSVQGMIVLAYLGIALLIPFVKIWKASNKAKSPDTYIMETAGIQG